jgi:AraC-like DNA-binding protein
VAVPRREVTARRGVYLPGYFLLACILRIAPQAARVGYGDPVTLRKLFVRATGLTPAEYRARYGPRAAPQWVSASRATARRSA